MFSWGQKMAPDRLIFFFFSKCNKHNLFVCWAKLSKKKKLLQAKDGFKFDKTTDLMIKVSIVLTYRCEVVYSGTALGL